DRRMATDTQPALGNVRGSPQSITIPHEPLTGHTFGGISLYTTGVTTRESSVELISPPIITMANGEIKGLLDQAMGSRPPMAVNEVRIMGRKRISPAFSMASLSGTPSLRN